VRETALRCPYRESENRFQPFLYENRESLSNTGMKGSPLILEHHEKQKMTKKHPRSRTGRNQKKVLHGRAKRQRVNSQEKDLDGKRRQKSVKGDTDERCEGVTRTIESR